MNPTNGLAKCPYSPHANVTSFMSEKGVYFAGTPMDFAGTDSAIVKDVNGIIIRTTQYDSMWLNEPQFVGSFETESYVYFLFREGAVEYMNCGKVILNLFENEYTEMVSSISRVSIHKMSICRYYMMSVYCLVAENILKNR